jgi:hypothetical protein
MLPVAESYQLVEERRQIHRSPGRPAPVRLIPTSAPSNIQILHWRTGVSSGGLCEGRTRLPRHTLNANVLQAEQNLQDAWNSCYARSQKNKT